jgi:hypothetical protein
MPYSFYASQDSKFFIQDKVAIYAIYKDYDGATYRLIKPITFVHGEPQPIGTATRDNEPPTLVLPTDVAIEIMRQIAMVTYGRSEDGTTFDVLAKIRRLEAELVRERRHVDQLINGLEKLGD